MVHFEIEDFKKARHTSGHAANDLLESVLDLAKNFYSEKEKSLGESMMRDCGRVNFSVRSLSTYVSQEP
jgi:hypothetical protein